MKYIFYIIILSLILISCDFTSSSSSVNRGVLICNPINAVAHNLSTGIVVKWEDDNISFIADDSYHRNHEIFTVKNGVWSSWCKPDLKDNGEIQNYCSNAGEVSFFNGQTLVRNSIEYTCRNEKALE